MGNTNSCIRHLKEVFSSLLGGSNVSEYRSAPAASETEYAATSSPFFSARRESSMMGRTESGTGRSIEEQIEHSKCHWSQLLETGADEEGAAEISNVEEYKTLQMHPTWGSFFWTFDEQELVVGEKFAEGGRAELYEAQVK